MPFDQYCSDCKKSTAPCSKHGSFSVGFPERTRTPHKCPVCNGQKIVQTPPWVPGDQQTYSTSSLEFYDCGVCGGTGIVWDS